MAKKIVEVHEYKSWFHMIFRPDNWVRFIGLICMVYAYFEELGSWKNEYIGEVKSDVVVFILGVIITAFGPDIRKYALKKFNLVDDDGEII